MGRHIQFADLSLDGVPRRRRGCTSRRSTTPSRHRRPTACACTSAGATTRARTTTTCRSPTSSTSSSRRGRAASRSRPPTRATRTSGRCSSGCKLPEGKVLIPGVIESKTNFIEHPELVAQRIGRYAEARRPRERHRRHRLRLRHLGRPGRGRSRRRLGQAGQPGRRRAPGLAGVLGLAVCPTIPILGGGRPRSLRRTAKAAASPRGPSEGGRSPPPSHLARSPTALDGADPALDPGLALAVGVLDTPELPEAARNPEWHEPRRDGPQAADSGGQIRIVASPIAPAARYQIPESLDRHSISPRV